MLTLDHYRSIFNTVNDVIFVHDAFTGEILEISKKCIDMYGYTPDEIKKMDFSEIMADDSTFNFNNALNLIKSAAVGNEHIFQWKAKNKFGKEFWVEVNLKGACIDAKIIVLAVVRDITDRKFKDEELNRLNKKLKEQNLQLVKNRVRMKNKNRALEESRRELEIALSQLEASNFEMDQLLYKTSHDLTAPLNSMLGLINVAKLEKEDLVDNYWLKMESSIIRMKHFIKSMLDYGRTSRKDNEPIKIDFKDLIDDAIAELEYLEGFKMIKIKSFVDNNSSQFINEHPKLSIIFCNIISNAIKYRMPNAIDSYLNIQVRLFNNIASITFSDNGIGICEEQIDKVFDMFTRCTENSNGSGLGMYIVKQTVDKLKGQISLTSKLGVGTTIEIQLPCIESKNIDRNLVA